MAVLHPPPSTAGRAAGGYLARRPRRTEPTMPAVPNPAEPCALRARSWTLSPVSPPPPRSRLRAAAGGPGARLAGCSEWPADRSEGGLGCGVRDLWLLASTRCWGKPPPGSPLGADPRLWSQPLSRRVRVGWGALHSHVLAVFFFFSLLLSEKGGAFRHPTL